MYQYMYGPMANLSFWAITGYNDGLFRWFLEIMDLNWYSIKRWGLYEISHKIRKSEKLKTN